MLLDWVDFSSISLPPQLCGYQLSLISSRFIIELTNISHQSTHNTSTSYNRSSGPRLFVFSLLKIYYSHFRCGGPRHFVFLFIKKYYSPFRPFLIDFEGPIELMGFHFIVVITLCLRFSTELLCILLQPTHKYITLSNCG